MADLTTTSQSSLNCDEVISTGHHSRCQTFKFEGMTVSVDGLNDNPSVFSCKEDSGTFIISLENFSGSIKLNRAMPSNNRRYSLSGVKQSEVSSSASNSDVPSWLQLLMGSSDGENQSYGKDTPGKDISGNDHKTSGSHHSGTVNKKAKTSHSNPVLSVSSSSKEHLQQKSADSKPLSSEIESSMDSFELASGIMHKITMAASAMEASTTYFGRQGHALVAMNQQLIIFGGESARGETCDDVILLDLSDEIITPRRAICESKPRSFHTAIYLKSSQQVAVFGGVSHSSGNECTYHDSILLFDPVITLWYPPNITGKPPSARSGHTACLVYDRYMVVYGGGRDGKYPHNIHVLDTSKWHWSTPKCDGKPPKARTGHSCHEIGDGKLLYFGGTDAEVSFNDVHLLSCNAKGTGWTWEQPNIIGVVKPSTRCGHTCALLSNRFLFVHGGWDNSNNEESFRKDSFVLDTHSWCWYSISVTENMIKRLDLDISMVTSDQCDLQSGEKALDANYFKINERGVVMPYDGEPHIMLFGGLGTNQSKYAHHDMLALPVSCIIKQVKVIV